MQSELIESVRALAEAQKAHARQPHHDRPAFAFLKLANDFDFTALLAALERAERIEKAAKARKFAADMFYALPADTSPDQ